LTLLYHFNKKSILPISWFYCRLGWGHETLRLRSGQRPTSPGNLCWVSLSLNPTYKFL